MTTYQTKINYKSFIWLFAIISLNILLVYDKIIEGKFTGLLILLSGTAIIWYFTFIYPSIKVDGNSLILKSTLGKNVIDINSIHKIERNQNTVSLPINNPYQKGITIHYNQYDDIFIAPKEESDLIAEIRKINPNIEVIS